MPIYPAQRTMELWVSTECPKGGNKWTGRRDIRKKITNVIYEEGFLFHNQQNVSSTRHCRAQSPLSLKGLLGPFPRPWLWIHATKKIPLFRQYVKPCSLLKAAVFEPFPPTCRTWEKNALQKIFTSKIGGRIHKGRGHPEAIGVKIPDSERSLGWPLESQRTIRV